jgi:hypothetical protein
MVISSPVDGSYEGLEESSLLEPAFPEGGKEGVAEILGDEELAPCDLDGLVDGSDEAPEEVPMLKKVNCSNPTKRAEPKY